MSYQTSCNKAGCLKEDWLDAEWKREKIRSDGKGEAMDLNRENREGETEALESWEERERER